MSQLTPAATPRQAVTIACEHDLPHLIRQSLQALDNISAPN
ncbi:hypothetical protein [Streptomyces melanogenes]